MTRFLLTSLFTGIFATLALAQDVKPEMVKSAPSKVVAVTVYQKTALVTREVTLPDAAGVTEVVVTPMPATTMQSSLYAETVDGARVMSIRYRARAIAEDTREEVRKIDTVIKGLNKKVQVLQSDLEASKLHMAFLAKMESFTTATMIHLTDKGHLDSEKAIALATFIKENRSKQIKDDVATKQQMEELQAEIAFNQRLLGEKSGGPVRTERDAIILVDKTKAGAATLKLNYLVNEATWRPQYKLRAGMKEKDPILVEYQASISQRTGEDWSNVEMTLSTAQPLLNASPPDLKSLELSIATGSSNMVAQQGAGDSGGDSQFGIPNSPPGGAPSGPGGQAPATAGYGRAGALRDLMKQSKDLKSQAVQNFNTQNAIDGNRFFNESAALDQYRELLLTREEVKTENQMGFIGTGSDGPTVTYRLKNKTTLPSRADEQILEVAKLELAPKFYYKAVPVLSPHVYRIADLSNTSDLILLGGDATMYIGTDFVGQTKMPLVAIGKPFTMGFGVDPQLQVTRKIVDKTKTTQGGNQVHKFNYKILLSSYKQQEVEVQVWDRMPHAEAVNAIAITFTTEKSSKLSEDALYVRDDKPKNLLRWDVKVGPKQNGENAMALDYEFKMELDKTVNITGALSK